MVLRPHCAGGVGWKGQKVMPRLAGQTMPFWEQERWERTEGLDRRNGTNFLEWLCYCSYDTVTEHARKYLSLTWL